MTERSIEDLLNRLPRPAQPDPTFEARLRQRLTQELTASEGEATAAAPQHEVTRMEVLDLEATTTTTIPAKQVPIRWLQAGAAAAVVALGVGVALMATQDDDPSLTVSAPDTTFVGASLQSTAIDLGSGTPYFVAVHGDTWVLTLAGDLLRIDDSGDAVQMGTVPAASLMAADSDALWVADAIGGDVLRLDPQDASVVAEIETGIDVMPSLIRVPSEDGTSGRYALIGGIVSNGESVWVGDRAGRVLRIDAATNEIVDSFEVPVRPDQLQLDGDHLLAVNLTGNEAAVLDAASGDVEHPVERLDNMAGAAVLDGALYLKDGADGTVTRIDLEGGAVRTSQPLGPSADIVGQAAVPTGLVVSSAGVLAYTDAEPASLHILDPETLVETGSLEVGADHGDMVVAPDGSVWLVRADARSLIHITPRPR
jgi:DNA-binding beta-propeller fold protein YncE